MTEFSVSHAVPHSSSLYTPTTHDDDDDDDDDDDGDL
jgi:hypothetical protein